MKLKKFIGWFVILFISLIPVFLLFVLGPKSPDLFTYGEFTHKMGQVVALIGMTMFAMTFILSTRTRFLEDIFGGLDKVYVAHSVLGATALITILLHPILLVLKFIPNEMYRAAIYLAPSRIWSVNFGIIALIGLIMLIFFTLLSNMKYHSWKISHKFMGLAFGFAVLHIFLVQGTVARDYIFSGYLAYAIIISAVGLIPYIYTLIFKDMIAKKEVYIIEEIEKTKDVVGLTFKPKRKALSYQAGQFAFFTFYNDQIGTEPHPFSIASKSDEPKIKVYIKNLGDYTSKLSLLKIGDKVKIEGPYGRFSFQRKDADQVWVAGGIGITPFIGMAQDLKGKSMKNKIDLYYTVRTADEFVGLETLKSIEAQNKNFHVYPWISKDKGYLSLDAIKEQVKNISNREYYLCGPPSLKESMMNALVKEGVSPDRIYEEAFKIR